MIRWERGVRQVAVLGRALAGLGCATPVGVYKMDARSVHEQLTRSVLSSNRASLYSDHVLRRAGLVEKFRREPAQTLAYLHETIVWDLATGEKQFTFVSPEDTISAVRFSADDSSIAVSTTSSDTPARPRMAKRGSPLTCATRSSPGTG